MIENSTSFQNMFLLFIKYVHLITISSKYRGTFIFSWGIYTKLLFYKESNKRCKSLWKNVEPHSSTIGLMQKYPPIFFLFYVSSFY